MERFHDSQRSKNFLILHFVPFLVLRRFRLRTFLCFGSFSDTLAISHHFAKLGTPLGFAVLALISNVETQRLQFVTNAVTHSKEFTQNVQNFPHGHPSDSLPDNTDDKRNSEATTVLNISPSQLLKFWISQVRKFWTSQLLNSQLCENSQSCSRLEHGSSLRILSLRILHLRPLQYWASDEEIMCFRRSPIKVSARFSAKFSPKNANAELVSAQFMQKIDDILSSYPCFSNVSAMFQEFFSNFLNFFHHFNPSQYHT